MNKETLFTESQRFRQWWLWLLLLGVNGYLLWDAYRQFIANQQLDNTSMSNTGYLWTVGIVLLVTALIASCRLDTNIKRDGIYVRFYPFHFKTKYFIWDELEQFFVREYSPLKEFGGWGIRYGFFGKGTAYNVSGNRGLQLEFTNHKKLLIGTNKPEELKEVLYKIEQLHKKES